MDALTWYYKYRIQGEEYWILAQKLEFTVDCNLLLEFDVTQKQPAKNFQKVEPYKIDVGDNLAVLFVDKRPTINTKVKSITKDGNKITVELEKK